MSLKRYSLKLQRLINDWRLCNLGRKTLEQTHSQDHAAYAEIIGHLWNMEQELMKYKPEALMQAHDHVDKRAGCPPSKQARGEDLFIGTEISRARVVQMPNLGATNGR